MLGDGEGKMHFHPENRAQPVPTSAPLARAQQRSLCWVAQLPPNMAMLWPRFLWCRLAAVLRGPWGREPWGRSGRGEAWVGVELPIPCRGWGRVEALQHLSKQGLGYCHITAGARGQARRLRQGP